MKHRLLSVMILITLVFALPALTSYAKDGPDPVASPGPQEHEDSVPSVMAVPNALSTGAVSENFEISSTMPGWQTTSVSAHVGDEILFNYAGGKWTVDHNLFDKVGPNGYSRQDDQKIYQGCKIDPTYTYGVVLARVGDGPYRMLPLRGTITATSTGNVAFHINDMDACLGDNEGAITYTVTNSTKNRTGGRWISPDRNFTVSSGSLKLSAQAWAKPGGPAVSYVKFTAFYGYRWHEIAKVNATAGSDVFEYTWNNSSNPKLSTVPQGPLLLSFDVYFTNGKNASAPAGYQRGMASSLSLLAPFPSGVTFNVHHGYNDTPVGVACDIGSMQDHCSNQQFGLDLSPTSTWNGLILAPASGTLKTWVPTSGQGDNIHTVNCLNFQMDDGKNLNICHFASRPALMNQHVEQGRPLGYVLASKRTWVHISIDDRPQACGPSPRDYCAIQFVSPYSFEGFDLSWDGTTSDQRSFTGVPSKDGAVFLTSTNACNPDRTSKAELTMCSGN